MTEKVKLTALVEKSLLAHAGKTCKLAENIREKLTELICKFCNGLSVADITPPYGYENLADHLIANGVTVQEWIPVSEPPKEKINCIVHYKHAYCDSDGYFAIDCAFYDGDKFQLDPAYKATHWMPLPEPPKGD